MPSWRLPPRVLGVAIVGLLLADVAVVAFHDGHEGAVVTAEGDGDPKRAGRALEIPLPTVPEAPEVTLPPVTVTVTIPPVTVPPAPPNPSLLGKVLYHSRSVEDRPPPTTGPITPSGRGYDLWVMDADGSNQRRLTDGGRDGQPDLSADGTRVAWVSGADNEVWTMDANGEHRRRVATCPLSCSTPRWSPSGDRIAYVSYTAAAAEGAGGYDVVVIAADGSSPRRYETDVAENDVAWSPDGTRIAVNAFYSARGLYQLDLAAGSLTRIVDEQAGSPDWSPDGSRILWTDDHSRLVTVAPDGSNLTRLTPWDSQRMSGRWMPDGQHIVYDHFDGQTGIGRIAMIAADGTGERFLTDGIDDDASPAA